MSHIGLNTIMNNSSAQNNMNMSMIPPPGVDLFGSSSSSNLGTGLGLGSMGGIGSSLMLCQQSPLQALVTCSVPRELQEDIQELGQSKHIIYTENYDILFLLIVLLFISLDIDQLPLRPFSHFACITL